MDLFWVVILLGVVAAILKIKRSKKKNLPPSPPKLPIIGNIHQITSLPHKSFRSLSEKYGPLMLLHLGNIPTLVVSSLDMVKEITKNHDLVFADRPFFTAVDVVFNGCLSLSFGPYGHHLKEAKKLCVQQLFNTRKVQEFHFIRKEEVAKFVNKIRKLSINNDSFNISQMFTELAHNILSRSAFGCLYDENEDGTGTIFGEVSRRSLQLLGRFCFKDMFPILGWIDHLTGFMRDLNNSSKEINDFLDRVIEDRLALMNDDEKLEDKKYLVDTLLYLQNEGFELDLSKHNLKALLKDMFLGGVDSVSVVMEWLMAELMKNPRIRKKVQEEVRRVVGNKSEITQADIREMKYFKCVVKENMRFHGAGLIARQTSANVKVQGYDIPPKARVMVNIYAIQRDPKLWDRPEEFLPERFLVDTTYDDDDDDNNGQNQQVAFSFGIGRRACPGMAYAYAEIEYVLANLLYWFDWELPDGSSEVDLDMSEVCTFSIHKKTPLCVVAHPHC